MNARHRMQNAEMMDRKNSVDLVRGEERRGEVVARREEWERVNEN